MTMDHTEEITGPPTKKSRSTRHDVSRSPSSLVKRNSKSSALPQAPGRPGRPSTRNPVPPEHMRRSEDGYISSGDEYTSELRENYIGLCGALAAEGVDVSEVLCEKVWNERLDEDEREHLRSIMISTASVLESSTIPKSSAVIDMQALREQRDAAIQCVFSGENILFGVPRKLFWSDVLSGSTHPRTRRWKQKVVLIQKRHYLLDLRQYQNNYRRSLLARKNPCDQAQALALEKEQSLQQKRAASSKGKASNAGEESGNGKLPSHEKGLNGGDRAGLNAVSGGILGGGADMFPEWDEERKLRVKDFRKQEVERYSVPEKPFVYRNHWGESKVAPLKRGPALDGGRPREHFLLKNDRPSHVTILCLVRDAASRMTNGVGTRHEICDLLRESQFIREGANSVQLNTVVSGALDRLHYEKDPCVKFVSEGKAWQYLHNDRPLDSFTTPAWSKPGPRGKGRKTSARTSASPVQSSRHMSANNSDAENDEDE